MLFGALAAFSLTVNAQVNFKDSGANMAQAGITRDTIKIGEISGTKYYQLSYTWHFNTDRSLTLLENPSIPGNLGAPQKVSTRKGWRGVGVLPSGYPTGLAGGNFGKSQSYTGGGDPVYFASVAALREYLGSTTLKYETGNPLNAVDSAVSCVFKMPNGGGAWAVYPGKYKKTDTRLYYNLGGSIPTSDFAFTVMTYDAGTSGKTVSAKLVVSLAPSTDGSPSVNAAGIGLGADKADSLALGNNGPVRYEKTIFTSSSNVIADSVRVNICETFGLSIDVLAKKKVILALITEASDLTPEAGKYDPVIAFDNFHLNFWLETPSIPAGIKSAAVSTINVVGKQGQIEVLDADTEVTVYNITGLKVAVINPAQGSQTISVPAGVYLVAGKNQQTAKVLVK